MLNNHDTKDFYSPYVLGADSAFKQKPNRFSRSTNSLERHQSLSKNTRTTNIFGNQSHSIEQKINDIKPYKSRTLNKKYMQECSAEPDFNSQQIATLYLPEIKYKKL